jgi:hypothetical protein
MSYLMHKVKIFTAEQHVHNLSPFLFFSDKGSAIFVSKLISHKGDGLAPEKNAINRHGLLNA